MYLLGIDLETTGLDPKQNDIIEVGAILWDANQTKPVRLMSELVQTNQVISPEITEITGLTNEDVSRFGKAPEVVLGQLKSLAENAQYIVAHNGREFDRLFLERYWQQWGSEVSLPWIDTVTDVPYDDKITSRKLTHLCAEHGFLNPFAHRAVFDVMSMLKVLSHYEFSVVETFSRSPTLKLVAKVSYDDREKAKKAGFRWDPAGKVWFRTVKECQLPSLQFEFPTETLI